MDNTATTALEERRPTIVPTALGAAFVVVVVIVCVGEKPLSPAAAVVLAAGIAM